MRKQTACCAAPVLAALLFVLAPYASAATMRHDRNPQDYLDAGAFFTSVGRVDGVAPDFSYIASGTLIAPNWVLTAGHVVDVAQSLNFSIGGTSYTAEQWIPHPSWDGNLTAGYDIGLIKLPVELTGIQPATLYTGSSELGRIGTFVGFGRTGTGLTGGTTFDGQKRGAQNMLDMFYDSSQRIILSDFDNPDPLWGFFQNSMGSSTPLYLEGLIAPGDSGGGVFMNVDNAWVLAGVNSFVGAFDGNPDSSYGDISGVIRVSAFVDWITGIITGDLDEAPSPTDPKTPPGHAKRGGPKGSKGTFVPALAIVPEPGTGLLLLIGLCTLGRRRR